MVAEHHFPGIGNDSLTTERASENGGYITPISGQSEASASWTRLVTVMMILPCSIAVTATARSGKRFAEAHSNIADLMRVQEHPRPTYYSVYIL